MNSWTSGLAENMVYIAILVGGVIFFV